MTFKDLIKELRKETVGWKDFSYSNDYNGEIRIWETIKD